VKSAAAVGLSVTAIACHAAGRGADDLAKRAAGTHTGSFKAFIKKGANYVPGYQGSTCSVYDTLIDNGFVTIHRKAGGEGERDVWVLRRENVQVTIYYSLPKDIGYSIGQAVGARIDIVAGEKLEQVVMINFGSEERHRHEKILKAYVALTTPVIEPVNNMIAIEDEEEEVIVSELFLSNSEPVDPVA